MLGAFCMRGSCAGLSKWHAQSDLCWKPCASDLVALSVKSRAPGDFSEIGTWIYRVGREMGSSKNTPDASRSP